MKNNRGLGKGLSALFAETEEDYGKSLLFDEPETEDKGKEGVQEVDLSPSIPTPISRARISIPTRSTNWRSRSATTA